MIKPAFAWFPTFSLTELSAYLRSQSRRQLIAIVLFLSVSAPVAAQAPAPTVAERLGYPPDARLLILHADDVGMMQSVNRASFEALEKGWITSASILVPCPWFPEVARFARSHPDLDLGIHLALNSEWTGVRWGPASPRTLVPSLLDAEGYMPLLEESVMQQGSLPDVEAELRAQIERARAAGIRITHLDSHMGTLFRSPEFFEIYLRLGRAYGLPVLIHREDLTGVLKGANTDGLVLVDRVLAIRPGVPREKWLDSYKQMMAGLPPGIYELILHLGYDDEELRAATWDHPDWGATWRQADFDMVRSREFHDFLQEQGFILVRWEDLRRALPAEYRRTP